MSWTRTAAPSTGQSCRAANYSEVDVSGLSPLPQNQTAATRITANTYPMGSLATQKPRAIAIVRATLTRIDRHSCKCANTPPSIGQHPGGPEASDPSDEVRAASAATPLALLPPSLVSECGSVLVGLSHPGTGSPALSGLEAYTPGVCGGRCTPIPLPAVDDLDVPADIYAPPPPELDTFSVMSS